MDNNSPVYNWQLVGEEKFGEYLSGYPWYVIKDYVANKVNADPCKHAKPGPDEDTWVVPNVIYCNWHERRGGTALCLDCVIEKVSAKD